MVMSLMPSSVILKKVRRADSNRNDRNSMIICIMPLKVSGFNILDGRHEHW